MNPAVIVGILRHLLTALGGYFVAKGNIDSANAETIVGSLAAIAGVVLSVLNKKKPTGPVVVTQPETDTK
jgi:hypothetical protein